MFVQPWMLYALPVIALPVIIHLINQRRFQTVRWAAMRFLLMANRMSRGYARLRQWLILLARTLAVAGLILAMSRPMSSGWLSSAVGGKVDTTIVILDRSPSMQQQSLAGGGTKFETARDQLVRSLEMLQSDHYVVIDSAQNKAQEVASPAELAALPQLTPASASSDLPALLQSAYEYVVANQPGRTEIWIASDVRQNDWDAESGRWSALRDSFQKFPLPVRFHLLAYPQVEPANRTLQVTDHRVVTTSSGPELLLSLKVEQAVNQPEPVKVPVQLELNGVRTTLELELTGTAAELKEHSLPLTEETSRGWGRVTLPADANNADNEFYFVYDRPAPRKTLLVAEDPDMVRPLELAASISPDPGVTCTLEKALPSQLASVDWESVALVLWQAPLPSAAVAEELQAYVQRGGQMVCFPPTEIDESAFAGVQWTGWTDLETETPIATWMGDQDLLANTRSGAALPVGQLQVQRHCGLEGELFPLASLSGGTPLIARALTDERNVYFCGTTVSSTDSSFARDGVVLYVMLQRALAAGAESLGSTRQLTAARQPAEIDVTRWQALSETEALSTDFDLHAGAYRAEDQLLAVNRNPAEDRPVTLEEARVAGLFNGLDFDRVDDRAGNTTSLIQEIWRIFLALMMAALLVEAALCLPRKVQREAEPHKEGWDKVNSPPTPPPPSPWDSFSRRPANAAQEVSA